MGTFVSSDEADAVTLFQKFKKLFVVFLSSIRRFRLEKFRLQNGAIGVVVIAVTSVLHLRRPGVPRQPSDDVTRKHRALSPRPDFGAQTGWARLHARQQLPLEPTGRKLLILGPRFDPGLRSRL